MKIKAAQWRDRFSAGLIASVLLHLGVVAALLVHWNFEEHEPEKEDAVSVQIVQPPEEEEKAEEPPKQEEEAAKQEEKPPEPEPQPEETAEQEEPPPAQETAPVPAPEQTETAEAGQQSQSLQALKPVFEFGEEASGPEVSENGNASEGKVEDQPEDVAPAETVEDETAPTETSEPTPPPPELTASVSDSAIADMINATVPEPEEPKPETKPEQEPPKEDDELKQASTIFSETEGAGKAAVTAMAKMPRGVRGGQLCATELREQLRHAARPYRPDILPTYSFPAGNVLQVNRGAFRNAEGWHNIRFRCEINTEGTKITGFAFDVGDPIPRAEWAKRGLPEN